LTDVIFPKDRDDLAIIASGTQLGKEHHDKFIAKPEKDGEETRLNTPFGLILKDPEF
jgi:hypothetical protein